MLLGFLKEIQEFLLLTWLLKNLQFKIENVKQRSIIHVLQLNYPQLSFLKRHSKYDKTKTKET